MKVNKDVEYALMALGQMTDGGLYPATRLSQQRAIPYKLLSKIMQRLKEAGVVESIQGVNGGYRLSRDAESITLQEVVQAIHEESGIISCTHMEGCAIAVRCHIRPQMMGLQSLWEQLLGSISLGRFLTMGQEDARMMLGQLAGH